jgi:hypothetical protein
MRKGFALFCLLLVFPITLHAEVDGRTSDGVFKRIGRVMARGVLNVVGLPAELFGTAARETEIHPKLWPVTMVPRGITNIIIRATSAVNDLTFFPLYLPFTNDITPWTEAFDLPVYPWQKE